MKRTVRDTAVRTPLMGAILTLVLVAALATVAYASGGGEGGHHVDTGKQLKDFIWRVVDFVALAVILGWAIKKADMKKSLADRSETIGKALREAEEAKAAAEKKFAEYNTRLAKANEEIDQLQAAIRQEGQAEKARIVGEAQAAAVKLREQAQQAADQEVLKARAELREEAARLAVKLAEQTLKEQLKKDDQDRLVGEYLAKVVNLK
jgi:F-type H+-transporting ATPase subunit b